MSPLRVLRQAVTWPVERVLPATGRHRLQPVLLRDDLVPAPDEPTPHEMLDEEELHRLLDEGAAEVLESAACPCCDRTTPHARQNDGSLRCWNCGTETPGGDA
ncbi:hypothetical protein AB0D11_02175 [Streptomyces monashensis]|uniref:hypothetical protein n=1 Tax=Streptomyces monashensis TaxID=1678012 RepID=UPI0033FFF2AA